MKPIKYSTAKRCSKKQLYRHLDRLLVSLDCNAYIIDYQYWKAYIWYADEHGHDLWPCMNNHDYCRACAIDVIMRVYTMHGIDHDFPSFG